MPDTRSDSVRSLVYFAGGRGAPPDDSLSHEELESALGIIGEQVIKERVPDARKLESILRERLRGEGPDAVGPGTPREGGGMVRGDAREDASHPAEQRPGQAEPGEEAGDAAGSASVTKLLRESGYLRDGRRWLTDRGFLLVGYKLLRDALRDMGAGEPGAHETRERGDGDTTMDTVRRFEPGSDMSNLDAQSTLLNAVMRAGRGRHRVEFPLGVEPEDMSERERLDDVRTAMVYCIDLSSTMRYRIRGGQTRMEAAKIALWSLYALSRKHFPGDSVSVVGFASLASVVRPQDIPYLATYTAKDGFLHYTNYQAALRLAAGILGRAPAQNKRIVLITDGQPSACLVDDEGQKEEILSEKPYSRLYSADDDLLLRVRREKGVSLDAPKGGLVYLCYRYKKVDPRIHQKTLREAKRCLAAGIGIDSIVVGDEEELIGYVRGLEAALRGRAYHIRDHAMNRVLISDYVGNTRRVLRSGPGL